MGEDEDNLEMGEECLPPLGFRPKGIGKNYFKVMSKFA